MVPPGNILVEVFEQDNISSFGMALPSLDAEKYNMWVKVACVGGNEEYRKSVRERFLYEDGDEVRVKRSVDAPFELNGRRFIVVYEEDINLIKKK
jgi:co-chaperonin GroES (HSP10)